MMLSVEGLNSFYGPAHILFDVGLRVGPGEVVALLGRNGAGKSTTFRSIAGLVPARRGRVRFGDVDISRSAPYEIARLGLGYVPEDRRIFTELTVEENLSVGRQRPRAGAPTWDPERLYDLVSHPDPARATAATQAMYGMRKIVLADLESAAASV